MLISDLKIGRKYLHEKTNIEYTIIALPKVKVDGQWFVGKGVVYVRDLGSTESFFKTVDEFRDRFLTIDIERKKLYCPVCNGEDIVTERKPNGNTFCMYCKHIFDPLEILRLEYDNETKM